MNESLACFTLPVLLFLAVIALTVVAKSIVIIRQYEKGIVLRLGKYNTTRNPGIAILIPFIESLIRVDMREKVINVAPQKVITEDNVSVIVDAVVYFKIVDPAKSVFEVEDFEIACTTLAQTNLRNLIGEKTLDESLVARDSINTSLRIVLDEATNAWGVKVTRVEVQKIDPPADITDAMSRQMKAEREKRARILEAEGVSKGQITEAEGQKQSAILKAEGDAQAILLKAEAEANALRTVSDAAEKTFTQRAEANKKLEVLEKTLVHNTKYVIPTNSDLINVLNLDGNTKENIVPIKHNEKKH